MSFIIKMEGDNMYIEVLVELKAKRIDKTFTYRVPDRLKEKIKVGIRVTVPFGSQKLEGFVMKIMNDNSATYEVKDIIDIVDENSILTNELIELGKYMQSKTLTTLIGCYQTMLPSALKAKQGLIINKKYDTILVLNNDILVANDKQQKIIDLINITGSISKKEANLISISAVKTLIKKDIVKETKEETYRLECQNNSNYQRNTLTREQNDIVFDVITNLNNFKPHLLHGVTGSGKTEVYLNIIDEVIKIGKEAIVLVPEISLTPQIVNKFRCRFGNKIAILHSALSNGEKYDEWRKIKRKEVSIVIGARSAVFAPFTNIGVIIIDEEHSQTYKQENNPKYNAIDIALYRSKKHNCPILLGSATPSVESYTRSKMGVYKLLELKSRVNSKLPIVKLVDMKDEIKKGNKIISSILKTEIQNKLDNNEQIILFLNRRGYSTVITCHNCGYVDKCPHCDIPLTYHKNSGMMRCHYCGYAHNKLKECPSCQSDDINDFGLGTQRLEEEIINNFMNAKVIRMDVDTTSKKGSHEKIITSFQNGQYNVLIGTQMISKGLDFDNVTLVGVINGDATLNIPDFRSGERTFQLLNQVAGRAGRSNKEGLVIIQGFNLDHYSIISASKHDYTGFYQKDMELRQKLKYPPYCNLTLIKVTSKNYEEVWKESNKISSYLKNKLPSDVIILGPNHPSIPKINDIYIIHIILKYQKTEKIMQQLTEIIKMYNINNRVNVEIDLNPIKI